MGVGRGEGSGTGDLIYANNAGTTWPKPPEVARAIAEAHAAEPPRYGSIIREANASVASFLGLPGTERLLLTTGCTSSLAAALHDLPWQRGDVVVTSSLEHHALIRPIRHLETWAGIRHEASPYAPGRPFDLEFLEAALKRGKVRLVAVTAASNVTGELLPVKEIAELAHQHGSLVLVDGAQTAGVNPTGVPETGADIYVMAGHKGPLGPQGIGVLWASPEVSFRSPAATCDISGGDKPADPCSDFPGYCDVGSANVAAAAGLAAGVAWRDASSTEDRGSKPRALAAALRDELKGLPGVTLFGGGDNFTATTSLRIGGLPVSKAEPWFRENGIIVRAAQHCAPMALQAIGAPEGTIRISFGPFNTETDLEKIVDTVKAASRL